MKNILVTGGAGYIGSHTLCELLESGYNAIVVDDLSNSKYKAIERVEKITGKKVRFYENNILDKDALRKIFSENDVYAVINFAGFKAVGESVAKPIEYYHNNIGGLLCLVEVMREFNCKKLVFSSSATVYGDPHAVPITEDFPLSTTNPYGSTKLFIEYILKDLYKSDNGWDIAILRYFNPVGAHPSGLIGEDPNGIPNNLCPYITKVAVGKLPYLNIFGDDYDTEDGTGVRDYIHVCDLAKGHVLAVDKMDKQGCFVVNLGTGNGYSVLQMVKAFSKALGREIPYKIAPRRPGDIAKCYADASLAKEKLGFVAKLGIDDMCQTALNWQLKNPNGYED
ncbi:MAG: UDP-glucose 4-epimerase GalE [Christensenellaceae bacterium]